MEYLSILYNTCSIETTSFLDINVFINTASSYRFEEINRKQDSEELQRITIHVLYWNKHETDSNLIRIKRGSNISTDSL